MAEDIVDGTTPGEDFPEDTNLGDEPVEDLQETDAEVPEGSLIPLTVEDVPELANLQPGDGLMLTVEDVSGDNVFQLRVVANPAGAEGDIEVTPEAGPIQQDILDQIS